MFDHGLQAVNTGAQLPGQHDITCDHEVLTADQKRLFRW